MARKVTRKRRQKTPARLAEDCAKDLQLLVRLKASNNEGFCQCVSCGVTKHYKDMQGGHYQGRSVIATKLVENNIHPQCRRCNLRSETSHVGYTLFMLEKYGLDYIKKLKLAAETPFKWKRKDIELLHTSVKQEIKKELTRLRLENGKD